MKILFDTFVKNKVYKNRKLDKDAITQFRAYIEEKNYCIEIPLDLQALEHLFTSFCSESPIFEECGIIREYPIMVYSIFDTPGRFEIFPYNEKLAIPNNYVFERRFQSMDEALKVTETWEDNTSKLSPFIKKTTLEDALKGTVDAWGDKKIRDWEISSPLDEKDSDKDLFDPKFVYFEWNPELEGKTGFLSNDVCKLKNDVKFNKSAYKVSIKESQDECFPFEGAGIITARFAYYDPNYEKKWAARIKEKISRDPTEELLEKIEKLHVSRDLREVLKGFLQIIKEKADKNEE